MPVYSARWAKILSQTKTTETFTQQYNPQTTTPPKQTQEETRALTVTLDLQSMDE